MPSPIPKILLNKLKQMVGQGGQYTPTLQGEHCAGLHQNGANKNAPTIIIAIIIQNHHFLKSDFFMGGSWV